MPARPRPGPVAVGVLSVLSLAAARADAPSAQVLSPKIIASRGDPNLELPSLRPGLWEYRRTQLVGGGTKPQSVTIRKCSDPSAEFKQKLAELKKRGCAFGPLRQSGRQFEAVGTCTAPDGSLLRMRDVIIVNSDSSYINESEAFVARQSTHTSLTAMRTGDCPVSSASQGTTQPPSATTRSP